MFAHHEGGARPQDSFVQARSLRLFSLGRYEQLRAASLRPLVHAGLTLLAEAAPVHRLHVEEGLQGAPFSLCALLHLWVAEDPSGRLLSPTSNSGAGA